MKVNVTYSLIQIKGLVRLGDHKIAEVYFNNQWFPICGHWFLDNNVGVNLFCQQLGFETGEIKEKQLKLLSDGLTIGQCLQGDTWLKCSQNDCNQLQVGGQCKNGGSCKKGQNAAVSIDCFNEGLYFLFTLFIEIP